MTTRGKIIYGVGVPLLITSALAAWYFPPDGHERSAWLQVAGRFHPLAVHLPVGLLLLVPLMELAGQARRWPSLRNAAGFVLWTGTVAAMASLALGWLLGYAGGYAGDLVLRHMWGGVALAAACVLAIALRPEDDDKVGAGRRSVYGGALAVMVGVLAWTGHQGGSLTRGENYLVERLPAGVQVRFGLGGGRKSAPHPYPASLYATHVQPIFENNCVVCHGSGKTKGQLRLDTFAHAMKGGEHGSVIVAADAAQSELVRRITLPREHKEFMPSEGKKPLGAREVKLLEQWIKLGASPTETFAELAKRGADLPKDERPAPPQAPDFRPRAAEIAALEHKLGVHLVPVSQVPTDGIILRTVSDPGRVDDATLAQLAPVAEFVVEAELARTKVTDVGLRALATCRNLRRLDLSQTAVTAAGLAPLAALPKVEWLSLIDTRVDAKAAEMLKKFPTLRTSYLSTPYVAPTVAKAPEPSSRVIPDDDETPQPKRKKGKAPALKPDNNPGL